MVRYVEPTAEQVSLWDNWVASRPAIVREIAERFDPWSLYLLRTTGQRVTIAAISEDGTVRVNVLAEFNATLFERSVFGIDPDDLEPCNLPSPDEAVGAFLTPEQVGENLDLLRVTVRPDLWEMGSDGKARRKNG